jgi:SNF2 family DNA or RNA helicase
LAKNLATESHVIVSRAQEKLVLKLLNPDRVTTVIPTARKFHYQGHDLVAVPHRLDEVRVLRNMGIEAPSPMLYHYDWPMTGGREPFKAQLETGSFLTTSPRAFVLNDMGTGKTLATLWAYDYLRSIGRAKKVLVIAPLSTLERTWADEVFANLPHLTVAVLHGTKDRRLKLLEEDVDIYVINHDGLKTIEQELIAKKEIDTVVVDELAAFRNASTQRWKCLSRVIKGRERVWGLTGTPTPHLPTDAWAQCRLIAPERVPPYFGHFKDSVMRQLNQFKWLPRESATSIVAEAMRPAVRFTRDQCVDLPPTLYQTREVKLTAEQKAAYKDMMTKLHTEFGKDQVTAVNEAVKLQKLVQIACGVVYGQGGEEIVLPTAPRIDEVRELIDEAGAKVIVFVPFKSVLRYVADELSKDYTVASVCGETSKTQRDTIFHNFQKEKDPRVLVAQPAAMSHGLTLTAANTIIWYAPITSNDIYEQANARIVRPGQKHNTLIVNIEGTPIERGIYERLKGKQALQGLLLGLLAS